MRRGIECFCLTKNEEIVYEGNVELGGGGGEGEENEEKKRRGREGERQNNATVSGEKFYNDKKAKWFVGVGVCIRERKWVVCP